MLDKTSENMLKFIIKNGITDLETLKTRFGEGCNIVVSWLTENDYIKGTKPCYPLINGKRVLRYLSPYVVTPKGRAYFEENFRNEWHYWVPIAFNLVLSIIAIIISIIALSK